MGRIAFIFQNNKLSLITQQIKESICITSAPPISGTPNDFNITFAELESGSLIKDNRWVKKVNSGLRIVLGGSPFKTRNKTTVVLVFILNTFSQIAC